jgi:hypothetical protein
MLGWDDFRIVKAIADAASLNDAAKARSELTTQRPRTTPASAAHASSTTTCMTFPAEN